MRLKTPYLSNHLQCTPNTPLPAWLLPVPQIRLDSKWPLFLLYSTVAQYYNCDLLTQLASFVTYKLTWCLSVANSMEARWNLQRGFRESMAIARSRVPSASVERFSACWTWNIYQHYNNTDKVLAVHILLFKVLDVLFFILFQEEVQENHKYKCTMDQELLCKWCHTGSVS